MTINHSSSLDASDRAIPVGLTRIAALTVALMLVWAANAHASFGVTSFGGSFKNPDGTHATQAGSHPDVTITTDFASKVQSDGYTVPARDVKDIEVELPPGLVGDPAALPKCSQSQLHGFGALDAGNCPGDTQVGTVALTLAGFSPEPLYLPGIAIYNVDPPAGVPAEFGFNILGVVTLIDFTVRSGGDNGLTAKVSNISQGLAVLGTEVTLWGVPADPVHDAERYSGPPDEGYGPPSASTAPRQVLLSAPTSCGQPLVTRLRADGWGEPNNVQTGEFDHDLQGNPMVMTGCERLPFEPTIKVTPDTGQADTPAGLAVEVSMPQDGLLNPDGLANADVQNTTVTLPPGVVINPGQASGLVACQPGEDGSGTDGPPSCPLASKVGTVEITTPLLPDRLEGDVYILKSNPPDLKLLVAASADGVNLKLVGDVHLDATTGQLTTAFANTPQLPFTRLKLAFSGGAQAALTTPAGCGTYITTADFTPWSAPAGAVVHSTSGFSTSSGPNGSACVSPLPFTPSLIAGSTTDQAGGYTGFSLLLQRGDGQQRVSSLQFRTPEGLLGKISTVPLCPEAQAAVGACGASSQIGHTVVASGPGPDPLIVPQPGAAAAPIYLTGPYKGAPYGLVIAVPVTAGPFDLGTVVVRAAIAVDRKTSQLTITTDQLPSILDGVPTDLRTINAVIDRPGFMFNPTSCASMSFSGTATSTEGAVAPISSHYQVGSCQSLKFKPDFKVSTSGHTSRKNGASLDAKIVYPTVALGANQASQQANIAKVKVDLPKQLPSRLTTLQKACLAATFEANPGDCPAASVVGTGKAVTPVLGVPLSGPAYFVSHGGEAFPSLVVVLQGDGVRVDLTGSTFISKAGITSSTFKSVPDVPITSFELKLPEGPHSALAANGNLCTSKLAMPTAFVGQNGAEIHQSTKLTVTGCTKAKKKQTKSKSKQQHKGKNATRITGKR